MLPGSIGENKRLRNKGKLRYSTKNYTNPFFQKDKNHSIRAVTYGLPLKIKFIALFCFMAAAAGSWILLYSKYFNIIDIEINGSGNIAPALIEKNVRRQISDSAFILFPQKNIFLFSKNRLSRSLESKYSFNTLDIDKKLPGRIIINYEEKKHAFIWSEDEKYYFADRQGNIISEANLLEIKQKDYPIINNQSGNKLVDNKTTINAEYLDFISEMFNKFKEYKINVKPEDKDSVDYTRVTLDEVFIIDRFLIDHEINTVKLVLTEGPTIYFNIKEDIDKQINKLVIVKNEKIKDEFKDKSYIDLRIGDSVYYR